MYKLALLVAGILFYSLTYGQKIKYTIPPGVVNDINKNDYKKIVDIAIPMVETKYKIESVNEGTILLAEGQGMKAFNLDNLVLKCIDVKDKNLWKDVIHDHFTQIFATIDEQKKIDPENFETVRKYLSLRIYTKEAVLQRGSIEKVILKSDLEDTYTLLMLDLPGAFTNVEKQMFDLWKMDTAEVFKIAQSNINKQKVEKVTQQFKTGKNEIEISLIGDENYAASYALDLAINSPELVGQWGSVVAMPNKGLVSICKVSKDKPVDFVNYIQTTKSMIEKSYLEHPQRISSQFFWYYKGRFTKITVLTNADGSINVISPYGLTELMTR